MPKSIQAIIFDCFGVLATDGWLPFKAKHFGHDPKLLERATDLNKQHDSGLLDHKSFIRQVAVLAQVPEAELAEQIQQNVPDEELLGYITRQLKPRYKIGLLSNASGNYLNRILGPERVGLFDAVGLSFEMGITKPERRAYEFVAELLGMAPEQCVMIDDQERHCTGAREAGMQAILYQDFAQMKRELEVILQK